MKKKIILSLGLTLFLLGCSSSEDPKIKAFLSNIDFSKAYEEVFSGEITDNFIRFDKNNVLVEAKRISIEFYKTDNFKESYIDIFTTYEDSSTSKNNSNKVYTKFYEENSLFFKKTIVNEIDFSEEEISYEDFNSQFISLFYKNDQVYKTGGYYYAEEFAVGLHGRSNFFTLDEENKTLTFEASDDDYFPDTSLYQKIVIDERGMLISCFQNMNISTSGDNATSEIKGVYNQITK